MLRERSDPAGVQGRSAARWMRAIRDATTPRVSWRNGELAHGPIHGARHAADAAGEHRAQREARRQAHARAEERRFGADQGGVRQPGEICAGMIDEFRAAGVKPGTCGRSRSTGKMSCTGSSNEPRFGRQAVYLDDMDPTVNPPIPRLTLEELQQLRRRACGSSRRRSPRCWLWTRRARSCPRSTHATSAGRLRHHHLDIRARGSAPRRRLRPGSTTASIRRACGQKGQRHVQGA